MNLAEEYRLQHERRNWNRVYESLPPLHGMTILDLGCGPGDQAAEFVRRGARVIGIDLADELLEVARSRELPNTTFIKADLRLPFDSTISADGIWCAYAAAYFPDLTPHLTDWISHLREGGWVVVIEIDDFLGHEPISHQSANLMSGYVKEALESGRYDFHMGRKLEGLLKGAGLEVKNAFTLNDIEFTFNGPASPEILEAWRKRLERMKLLHEYCGTRFSQVQREFLDCLTSPDHRCNCSVRCCVARK